jgi:hypothetical protein
MALTDATPARVFAKLLRDLGLALGGADAEWGVIYGPMPADGKSNFMAVVTTSAVRHAKLPDGSVANHWGVQLLVRSFKQEAGWLRGQAVVNRLNLIKETDNVLVAIDGHVYSVSKVMDASGPTYLGEQEKNLAVLHSVNFLFVASQVS